MRFSKAFLFMSAQVLALLFPLLGSIWDKRWFQWFPSNWLARQGSSVKCREQVIKCFSLFLTFRKSEFFLIIWCDSYVMLLVLSNVELCCFCGLWRRNRFQLYFYKIDLSQTGVGILEAYWSYSFVSHHLTWFHLK